MVSTDDVYFLFTLHPVKTHLDSHLFVIDPSHWHDTTALFIVIGSYLTMETSLAIDTLPKKYDEALAQLFYVYSPLFYTYVSCLLPLLLFQQEAAK